MRSSARLSLTNAFSLFFIFVIGVTALVSLKGNAHAVVTYLKRSTISEKTSISKQFTCGVWNIVPSPQGANNALFGVAATSTNDAWAIGDFYNGTSLQDQTLIEHWNGTSWSIASSPNPGTAQNLLFAVTTTSASDAWAVGNSTYLVNNTTQTLIEHWDGISWNVVPSPSAGTYNFLSGVTALSPSDVWAVGYFSNSNTPIHTLIEHWDGISWSIISSPNPTTYNLLKGVTALSSNNVWAVGLISTGNHTQTLIEHWDGISWSIVSSPNPGQRINELVSITQVPGTNQLWAVGDYGHRSSTLTEHWDGTRWTVIHSPNPKSSRGSYFQGVAAISKSNIWAVGFYINSNTYEQTFIEHWNGTQWTDTSTPNLFEYLRGVAQIPGTSQAWTVGQYDNMSTHPHGTLIEFYC